MTMAEFFEKKRSGCASAVATSSAVRALLLLFLVAAMGVWCAWCRLGDVWTSGERTRGSSYSARDRCAGGAECARRDLPESAQDISRRIGSSGGDLRRDSRGDRQKGEVEDRLRPRGMGSVPGGVAGRANRPDARRRLFARARSSLRPSTALPSSKAGRRSMAASPTGFRGLRCFREGASPCFARACRRRNSNARWRGSGYHVRLVPVGTLDEAFPEGSGTARRTWRSRTIRRANICSANTAWRGRISSSAPSRSSSPRPGGGMPIFWRPIDRRLDEGRRTPDSYYYKALAHWVQNAPVQVVPRLHVWSLISVALFLALAFFAILVLRRRVATRTRHLEAANASLRGERGKVPRLL